MGKLKNIHKRVGKSRFAETEHEREKSLFEVTGNIKEVPSRIGLNLILCRIFLYVVCFVVGLGALFRILAVPRFDYVVEKRLGDHYAKQFSDAFRDQVRISKEKLELPTPKIADITQDEKAVYVATMGHGLQVLNKENRLWHTVDANTTNGELINDLKEIRYQKDLGENRLWALGLDGSVAVSRKVDDPDLKFKSVFSTGYWHYIDNADISATLLIDESFLVLGSRTNGAGVYNIQNHAWLDLKEMQKRFIHKIIFKDKRLWFQSDTGVYVYEFEHQGQECRVTFLSQYFLKSPEISDIKVFAEDKALAFTEDSGCFVFQNGWSNKLLGGSRVPELSSENIRYVVGWEGRFIVIGEAIGIVEYRIADRNWRIVTPGPIPEIAGMDYDAQHIVVATGSGAYWVQKKPGSDEVARGLQLEGYELAKVALFKEGYLYLVTKIPEGGEAISVGWNDFGERHRAVIKNQQLKIVNKPEFNDVKYFQKKFWLATDSDGVICYDPDNREISSLNLTDQASSLGHVERIENSKGRPLAFSGDRLFELDEKSGVWRLLRKDLKNVRVEEKADGKPGDLYCYTDQKGLMRADGKGDKWFSGQGPYQLDPSRFQGALSLFAPDAEPLIYVSDTTNRLVYVYHIFKGVWDEPIKMPDKLSMWHFAPGKDTILWLNDKNQLYQGDDIIFGGNSNGLRPGDMDTVFRVTQSGDKEKEIQVYGAAARLIYQPMKGSWTRMPYPFFTKENKSEWIQSVFNTPPAWGGMLAKTNTGQIVWIDEKWSKALFLEPQAGHSFFDGNALWDLSDYKLTRNVVSVKEDKLATTSEDYFKGEAPDLSSILTAWEEQDSLNFVTPTYLSKYDLTHHTWSNHRIAPDRNRISEAKKIENYVYATLGDRIRKYDLNSYPTLTSDDIVLPSGRVLKADVTPLNYVVTVTGGTIRRVYRRGQENWEALSVERNAFIGDFNAVSKLYSDKGKSGFWIFDARNRMVAIYKNGNWAYFRLPEGIDFQSFWKEPASGRLYVIGRWHGEITDFPICYYDEGRSSFQELPGLPGRISEIRIHADRNMWIKTRSEEIIIYDLQNPGSGGVNITNIMFNAASSTRYVYYFNFSDQTYTRMPVSPHDMGFASRLSIEILEDVSIYRDDQHQITSIYIQTTKGIYYFEYANGQWSLKAECRVYGKTALKDALTRMSHLGSRVDPIFFKRELASFSIALFDAGHNPILDYLHKEKAIVHYSELRLLQIDKHPDEKSIKYQNLLVERTGQSLRFFFTSANQPKTEIPVIAGRLDIDDGMIDATADENGNWWVLRRNSLTCYKDYDLKWVLRYERWSTPVSDNAVLRLIDHQIVIRSSDMDFVVAAAGGQFSLAPYHREKQLYAGKQPAMELTAKNRGCTLTVGGRTFAGGARFPFDRILQIAESFDGIYVMVETGVWHVPDGKVHLGRCAFYPFPEPLLAGGELMADAKRHVRLVAGNQVYKIEPNFPVMGPIYEINDFRPQPTLVAEEQCWQWYFEENSHHLFFKAQTGDGGQWERIERLSQEGDSVQFKDDKITWVTYYKGRFYAGTRLGLAYFSGDGTFDKKIILNDFIREIKLFGKTLRAVSDTPVVYEFKEDTGQWQRNRQLSAGDIFDYFTPVFDDPLLEVKIRGRDIRMNFKSGEAVAWNTRNRAFSFDGIRDFAFRKGNLFVIDGQGNLVAYDQKGARISYDNLLNFSPEFFECTDNALWCVGKLDSTWTAAQFLEDEPRILWKNQGNREIKLAEDGGLAFHRSLENLPGIGPLAILPSISGQPVNDYWKQGRFSFDLISDIEAGDLWYSLTSIGLIRYANGLEADYDHIYPAVMPDSLILFRSGRMFVSTNGRVKRLNEENGELSNWAEPVFTRFVFDYTRAHGDNAYCWVPVETDASDHRPWFGIRQPSGETEYDVFYDDRFVWDQVRSGSIKPSTGEFWMVHPGYVSCNHLKGKQKDSLQLVSETFYRTGGISSNHTLRDAAFLNDNLFILLQKDEPVSRHAKDDVLEFFSDSVSEEAIPDEMIQKWMGKHWNKAGETEYPFWQPIAEYHLRDNTWREKYISYGKFHSNRHNFSFIGPSDYPIFSRLDWSDQYGKFSFDYLTSIYPVENTLWAGSKGGIVKLRFSETDGNTGRMQLERVLLAEDGLYRTEKGTTFYHIDRFKKQDESDAILVLESDGASNWAVQQFLPSQWNKEDEADYSVKKSTFLFSKNKEIRYLFKYDPIENIGKLYIQEGTETPVLLLTCASEMPDMVPMEQSGNKQYTFSYQKEAVTFQVPENPETTMFSPLKREVDQAEQASPGFKAKTTDPAGIEWGEVDMGKPAIRIASLGVFRIKRIEQEIAGINIGQKTIGWTMSSSSSIDEKERSRFYDADSGKVEIVSRSEHDIKWIDYVAKPGDSISNYLLQKGLIQKQGFFEKFLAPERQG
jgi:hypothetical protein